jgi:hypothetical protein
MRIIGYTPYVNGRLREPRAGISIPIMNGECDHLKKEIIRQFKFFEPHAEVDVYITISENDDPSYDHEFFPGHKK